MLTKLLFGYLTLCAGVLGRRRGGRGRGGRGGDDDISVPSPVCKLNLGLEGSLSVEGNSVCSYELAQEVLSTENNNLRITFEQGISPCADIAFGDRWEFEASGFMYVSGLRDTISIRMVSDVNDGIDITITHPDTNEAICEMYLWKDVPKYNNYHSTDAQVPDASCDFDVDGNTLYPFKLRFYHQSDTDVNKPIYNRAYLDTFFYGLGDNRLEFFHV